MRPTNDSSARRRRTRLSAGAYFCFGLASVAPTVALAIPPDVANLRWCAGSKDCLQWDAVSGAFEYRVYRGERASLPCVVNPALDSCDNGHFATATTGATMIEVPQVGRFYWFLVTAVDGSGEGGHGWATSGPRQSQHTGPCQPSCAPAPSGCSFHGDCCSSSCLSGTCQTACCVPTGGLCAAHADCCSGTCSAGACQPPCTPVGGTCSTTSQCCAGASCIASSCTVSCGDGVVGGSEQCDDGNLTPGDGCSPTCTVEPGFTCSGSPSVCVPCPTGSADCNGNPQDGCETNTTNNVNHCGACNNACPPLPNATTTCQNSACVIGSCNPGYADCNGSPADGCEVYLAGDPNHCGGCGLACSTNNITPSCGGGDCNGACHPGFADCNGNKRIDGCEINTTNNVNHCGACFSTCAPVANGTPSCSGSQCVAVCNAGFGNCNGSYADGCEANLGNNPNHCGFCGNACAPQASCISGQCVIP